MKYKKGYCAAIVDVSDFRNFGWLREAAKQCEQFILGIPGKQVMEEICPEQIYDPEVIREYWLDLKWISDVIILDIEQLDYQKIFDEIHFDVCFYGSEYGHHMRDDLQFMEEHKIAFIPTLPDKVQMEGNALGFPLEYNSISKKIVLFGTGAYFDCYMQQYGDKYKPAYAIDNAEEKWETEKKGVLIKSPCALTEENPEKAFVIICSRNYKDMIAQLQELGEYDYAVLLCRNEIALLENFYYHQLLEKDIKDTLKKIHDINYDMLEEFDQVCRSHDVQYFLNYGSLLGAIRHEGFIPWDNDIDTVMTRDNYKILSRFKDDFDDRYFWCSTESWGKKKYYDCVPRLGYKAAYIRLDEDECRFYNNLNNRIHLDIFFIDKTYDDFRGKWQRFELAVIYGLMNAYRHKIFFADYDKKMRLANGILRIIGRCIPLPWLRKCADKVASRFDKDDNAPYFFISNDALCKLNMLFPKRVFDHTVDLKFGRINAEVACEYDEMCRAIFSEYMNLPSKKERVPHLGRRLITSDLYVFREPDEG